jgi:flagellar protein FliS
MDDQFAQQAHREYLEQRVLSAHPVERVYLLYQVAIDSVNVALARLKDGDIFARGRAITKAHEAVDELNFALDHSVGASFTGTIAELYGYIQRQLVTGHVQKSEQALQEALSVLTTLADAWKEVVARTCGSGLFNSDLKAAHPIEASGEPAGVEGAIEVSEPHAAYGGVPQTPSISRDWSG